MRVKIQVPDRMTNTKWHRYGKPYWWVRVGGGDTAQFLAVPRIRGDEPFSAIVEVPDGTREVTVGVGPRDHGVRAVIAMPVRQEATP